MLITLSIFGHDSNSHRIIIIFAICRWRSTKKYAREHKCLPDKETTTQERRRSLYRRVGSSTAATLTLSCLPKSRSTSLMIRLLGVSYCTLLKFMTATLRNPEKLTFEPLPWALYRYRRSGSFTTQDCSSEACSTTLPCLSFLSSPISGRSSACRDMLP